MKSFSESYKAAGVDITAGYAAVELMKQHVIDDFGRGIWCLTNAEYYNPKTGIRIELTDYFL